MLPIGGMPTDYIIHERILKYADIEKEKLWDCLYVLRFIKFYNQFKR